ncbi:MAG TPA: hypothetical protein VG736_03700 [Vicinamibacterales bacterium]|nr:hypothetical protein [Vicinamibacterales bacterium]
MTNSRTIRLAFLLVTLVAIVFTRDVHAYLDPGTGSLVFQAVAAALAATAYAFRNYWGRLLRLFGRRKPESSLESRDKQA